MRDADFFFDRRLPGDDHVVAAAVELDDLDGDVLADKRVEVVGGADVHLSRGHEGDHADIDAESAFDAVEDAAENGQVFAEGLFQCVPGADAAGALVRQGQVAFDVLPAVGQHLDLVADVDGDSAVGSSDLLDGNEALLFAADVDDGALRRDFEDAAVQDVPFSG